MIREIYLVRSDPTTELVVSIISIEPSKRHEGRLAIVSKCPQVQGDHEIEKDGLNIAQAEHHCEVIARDLLAIRRKVTPAKRFYLVATFTSIHRAMIGAAL